MTKLNAWIVTTTLIIVGYITFNNFLLSYQSQYWPITQGIVTDSSIYGSLGKGSGTHPEIHYQFQIQGQTYTGDKLDFGGDREYIGDAANFVAQYPVGTKIKIYYDSNSPKNSVLFPEHNALLLNLILALVCWFLSGYFLYKTLIKQETITLPKWMRWLSW